MIALVNALSRSPHVPVNAAPSLEFLVITRGGDAGMPAVLKMPKARIVKLKPVEKMIDCWYW